MRGLPYDAVGRGGGVLEGLSPGCPPLPSRNPLREEILSLLAIRPMSGYDVQRTYQRAMQQIWCTPIG